MSASNAPETFYAKTPDGLSIAYQTVGDGPTDVVFVPTSHCIDLIWDEPSFASFLLRLAKVGRLICLDYRGFGASDPVPLGSLPSPEAWTDDTRVVLDAVGSTSAHIVAHGASGFAGMLMAATYPERVRTLTLFNASARAESADDYPMGVSPELLEQFVEWSRTLWGTGGTVDLWAPSRLGDEAFRRWSARFERGSGGPAAHRALLSWVIALDLRAVLPSVRVPTLVMHRADIQMVRPNHGIYLAEHIPNAEFVAVPGVDYWPFTEGADDILDRIEEFITGVAPVREPDRALATVLFTDIVSSTDHAVRLGDRQWTDVLNRHDALVNRELDRHRGRKVNPTGDGFLATFDGPARAIRCAQAICAQTPALGIDVRAGLHTGEVELRGNDIGGIAVHIGQRISALAGAGEVFVSRTVTELVEGSGISFVARGDHELKGVPGRWPVFAVAG